jgi:RNA polymerase sigma-70 factor (ECF subfamily)
MAPNVATGSTDARASDPAARRLRKGRMYLAGRTASMPVSGSVRGPPVPDVTGARAPMMPSNEDLQVWLFAVADSADRLAFARLFEHFAPRVKGYLMRSGSTAELAEELTQETMVAIWRKAASFDPARAALSTWVFAIARNLRIDYHRRGDGTAGIDDEGWDPEQQPADAHASPDELVVAAQRERGVHDAIARLPADQALVLRLSFFEEHPHAAIAEQLGIPLGTVKSRIRLAVAQLRKSLDRFGP